MAKTSVAALCLCAWVMGAHAATMVSVNGTLGDKALISINGGPAKVVATGDQLDGVRIVSVRGDRVTVEVSGQRRELMVGLGDALMGRPPSSVRTDLASGRGAMVLTADSRGQFSTQAQVNGISGSFLVDTGASVVTLPASLAKRAGINLDRATPIVISTANGRAQAFRVVLNTVKVGNLAANLVDAVVVEDAKLPFALLGMSFLNRMEMRRDGDSMTLLQRY